MDCKSYCQNDLNEQGQYKLNNYIIPKKKTKHE